MKKILIIGGAGYVGSVLVDSLLTEGYEVVVLDNCIYGNNNLPLSYIYRKGYKFIYGDLRDQDILRLAFDGVSDVVVLAGLVGDPITKKYPEQSSSINDSGIINLFNFMKSISLDRVIFVSTCSNYGLIPNDMVADEKFKLNPLSLYSKSKVSAEEHLSTKTAGVEFSPTILRFATAFGLSPRMRFDLTVSEFTREIFMGRKLVVFDPDTWRPYCHVLDFAALIIKVLEAPRKKVEFQVFNAGGEANNHTKRGLVNLILKKLPSGSVVYQENGSDPRNYRVDFTKVRSVLNFSPKYTVDDGVEELINALNQRLFDFVDVNPNLYGNYKI